MAERDLPEAATSETDRQNEDVSNKMVTQMAMRLDGDLNQLHSRTFSRSNFNLISCCNSFDDLFGAGVRARSNLLVFKAAYVLWKNKDFKSGLIGDLVESEISKGLRIEVD